MNDAEPDYLWPDVWSRRSALGVSGMELAAVAGIGQGNYSQMESGKRRIPARVWVAIAHMEELVLRVERDAQKVSPVDGVITLCLVQTEAELAAAYPEHAGLPVALARVGVGRAAAVLAAGGATVRILPAADPPTD